MKENCEKIDRDPAALETSTLVIAIIDENVTAHLIPDDSKQQAVLGSPEQVTYRTDQDQGAGRGRRRGSS